MVITHWARRRSSAVVPACGAGLWSDKSKLTWYIPDVTCPECEELGKADQVIAHMRGRLFEKGDRVKRDSTHHSFHGVVIDVAPDTKQVLVKWNSGEELLYSPSELEHA